MLIKDILSDFVEKAKDNFKKYGFLTPIFAGMVDNKPLIMVMPTSSQEEKENFSLRIQQLISKNRLTEYIMINEAWAVEVENDLDEVKNWLGTKGSLESWPGRKEIVQILYCSATEEIQYTADINRGIIPPVLENWDSSKRKVQFQIGNFSARFQSLFLKGKAGAN